MSLLELTAVELAKEIKAGKTTAVEAMKAVLEQIEICNNCSIKFTTFSDVSIFPEIF